PLAEPRHVPRHVEEEALVERVGVVVEIACRRAEERVARADEPGHEVVAGGLDARGHGRGGGPRGLPPRPARRARAAGDGPGGGAPPLPPRRAPGAPGGAWWRPPRGSRGPRDESRPRASRAAPRTG